MSTEYKSSYGIGYKVCESEGLAGTDDLEDGLGEYVDCECGVEFESFTTGNCWTGVMTGTYIGIKDPFKNGLNLAASKEKLDEEIKRLKLETLSNFGEIGGLLIY